ncbi:MAG: hypothetical protein E7482_02990 [Ruminococcaceae bacterium]|nr:hypothetical protein [Oscillospiraceae bacterium]
MNIKDNISADFAGLFYHAANLSKYSEEEFNALFQHAQMSQEIFDRCIKTAISIFDFENIKYLKEKYPEFAENCTF